ncbi:MAG: pyridoxine 5'-phosphate synthase [Candidatus Tectomicrobia bacterium]|uniref:Pyridoxine 5'-phosphate synthase n=1 Tax=Tectimicrobiota bacterium TaxID=2528274 RepID=A0A932I0I8_UNCTE|nr:pyridoxine 5'-phosphate synthase [Candidatus Tectomicrobia bacterium]
MARLCVNVDHVATIRQARRTNEPDPVAAALIAERSGAAGVTVHLREDRRHIQDRDLRILRQVVRGKLNLEMAAVDEMRSIALEIRPDQATLVPERRQEITTEGGLDAAGQAGRLAETVGPLRQAGIALSLFIDPRPQQLAAARELGADFVELNTAAYAEAKTPAGRKRELETLREAAERAHGLGLGVHAGHGLTYLNTEPVAALPRLEELNIGHSIVSHAVFVGFERAVREMAELIAQAGRG